MMNIIKKLFLRNVITNQQKQLPWLFNNNNMTQFEYDFEMACKHFADQYPDEYAFRMRLGFQQGVAWYSNYISTKK